jgi:hypothetical protein
MLDRVEPGAFGEHPACEHALLLAVEQHLVHFYEGGRLGRLCRRARVAHTRRHFQGAELRRLIERNLKARDLGGHLVEGGEHGDRVLDALGCGRRGGEERRKTERRRGEEGAGGPFRAAMVSLTRHVGCCSLTKFRSHRIADELACERGASVTYFAGCHGL